MARALKAAIHIRRQRDHSAAMAAGLARHGIQAEHYTDPTAADFVVVWGWKKLDVIGAARRVLVMERGYLPDRFAWTSCGWDGLNGRATFPAPQDGGERFERHFGHLIRPWQHHGDYALLVGQVEGDAAIRDVDFAAWLRTASVGLAMRGRPVLYRPHPLAVRTHGRSAALASCPPGVEVSFAPLAEDLAGAEVCVTCNSNTATEAVLAGVPSIATDRGSMAWPVTSHAVGDAPIMPDRTDWCWRLSWCQWTLEEIRSGAAWEALAQAVDIRGTAA